jgi:Hint domain
MPVFTLQWVYAPSDFSTAPPGEQGADAAGTPPFNVVLGIGQTPQTVTINDGNSVFDEVNNAGQTLLSAVTIGSTTYAAGTSIFVNYVITDPNGVSLYSITIGGNNTGNNTTTAFVTNGPLTPGQLYTFTTEANIGGGSVAYAGLACFAAGTIIETALGPRAVETLAVGDLVETHDHGPQTLRWIGESRVAGDGEHAPIRFEAGVIGNDAPLLVSPNHRVLVSGAQVELMFGTDEVLVPAKALVNGHSVTRQPCGTIGYLHLMFDRHELIRSNGAWSESYFAFAAARSRDDRAVVDELAALFPGLVPAAPLGNLVRPAVTVREGRLLAETDA